MSARQRVFERRLRFAEPFVEQHRLSGAGVLPAAVHVEMALAAMLGGGPLQPIELRNVEFPRAVSLPPGAEAALRLVLDLPGGGAGRWLFRLESSQLPESQEASRRWATAASGEGELLADAALPGTFGVEAARELSAAAVYARFHERGIAYGPDFQTIRSLRVGAGGARAALALPAGTQLGLWYLHPLLLDGVLQVCSAAVQAPRRAEDLEVYIPVGIECLRLCRPIQAQVDVEVRVPAEAGDTAEAEVRISGVGDQALATLHGVRMRRRFSQAAPRRAATAHEAPDGLAWEVGWEPEKAGAPKPLPGGLWVVFADAAGRAVLAAAALAEHGGTVIRVTPGPAFAQLGPTSFALPPTDPDAYHRLLAALPGPVAGVLHLWACDHPGHAPTPAALDAALDAAVHSPRLLVQALAGRQRRCAVWLVTCGAVPAPAPHPQLSPAQAGLWGLGRVIRLEHPGWQVRLCDLPPGPLPVAQAALQAELAQPDAPAELALRPPVRLRPTLIPAPATPIPAQPPIRAGGHYVLLGGIGSIGLSLAQHLVTAGAGALTLISRRPPSETQSAAIDALRAQGARIHHQPIDIADATALAAAVAASESWGGPLHGVAHCAGVLADGLVRSQRSDDVAAVLRPKVHGSWALAAALAGRRLDFVALCSSVSGVVGNLGQGAYAAANVYQDALAAWQQGQGRPWTSLAWGLWGEIGMGLGVAEQLRRRGVRPLPTADALREFIPAISSGAALRVISYLDGQPLDHLLPAQRQAPAAARASAELVTATAAPTKAARLARLRADLRGYLSSRLGLRERDLAGDIPFTELGVDSILGVTMAGELANRWGRTLPDTLFVEYANLDELAEEFVGRFDLPSLPAAQPTPGETGGTPEQRTGDSLSERETDSSARTHTGPGTNGWAPSPPEPEQRASSQRTSGAHDPIAVVALSGRFPGATDPEALWRLVREGGHAITEIPADRWDIDAWYDPRLGEPDLQGTYSRWGAFLGDIEAFDPSFFTISPREARKLDPQQRLVLEESWKALESAGMAGKRDIGVFVAATYTHHRDQEGLERVDPYSALGSMNALLANRVSYAFDLTGPSLTIDTLCSSSLVALHQAVHSLRRGECTAALVVGVEVGLTPWYYRSLSQLGALSSSGACRPFDRAADGFVPGEGVVAVLLEPLDAALRDRRHIWGVIRGSAVNHGGRASGLTVPRKPAQVAVIRAALADAGLPAGEIDLVEAHGTGTALGDPVEVEALTEAYRHDTTARQYCAIGSIKANIGHLEPAAGLAGLAKVLLGLRAGELPPAGNFSRPNERIRFEDSPFYVPDQPIAWRIGERLRHAAVSAFGLGGTNAHIIVEEAPPDQRELVDAGETGHVLSLAAHTLPALAARLDALRSLMRAQPDVRLGDVAFSLNVGRGAFRHRIAVVGRNAAELLLGLDQAIEDLAAGLSPRVYWGREPIVAAARPLDAELIASLLEHSTASREQISQLVTSGGHDPGDSPFALLLGLAQLYVGGVEVHWDRLYEAQPDRRILLPGYPFAAMAAEAEARVPERLTLELPADAAHPVWADHQVDGRPTLSAAALLVLASTAARDLGIGLPALVDELVCASPTSYEPTLPVLRATRDGDLVRSRIDIPGALAMRATLRAGTAVPAEPLDLGHLRERCPQEVPTDALYAWFAARGMVYGPALRAVRRLSRGPGTVFAELAFDGADEPPLFPDVAILDGALQTMAALTMAHPTQRHLAYRPFSLQGALITRRLPRRAACLLERLERDGSDRSLAGRITILDERGHLCMRIEQVVYRAAAARSGEPPRAPTEALQRPQERARVKEIEALLSRIVGAVLELPGAVDVRTPLAKLGLDSILATSIALKLSEALGAPVSPITVLEHRAIDDLAVHLEQLGALPASDPAAPQQLPQPSREPDAPPELEPTLPPAPLEMPLEVPGEQATRDAVAVIGMACYLPRAETHAQFWELLRRGADLVGEVPADRWDASRFFSDDQNAVGTTYSRWGAFLEDARAFDAEFFELYPRQAEVMDPQQRLLLQACWHALEHAGVTKEELAAARTGVFVGASYTHYREYNIGPVLDASAGLGNHNAILANRISYFLDLTGPCLTIDTLCSSSLVALHLAVRSLRSNECDYALVAGAQVGLSPWHYQSMSRLRALTVPSAAAQAAVVRAALADAHVRADNLSYVEAHGTGTALGDPIELDGLSAAFHPDTTKRQFCGIGSVKTNLGHLEPAAGLTGVLKVLLALQHEELPPSLHLQRANSRIDFAASPFYVTDRPQPWPRTASPRRAGVSSFGMGGVNAHVVLEEAPTWPAEPVVTRPVELLRLSAQAPEALRELAVAYVHALQQPQAAADLPHLVHTANRGRANLRYRAAVVGADPTELAKALAPLASGAQAPGLRAVQRPTLALLFTGQECQPSSTARDLAAVEPVVQASLARSAAAAVGILPVPLETLLADPDDRAPEHPWCLHAAIAAVEWALVELLASWGIHPDLVLGHSLGEEVAAAAARALAWPDALRLIATRARLREEVRSGLPAETAARQLAELQASITWQAPALPVLGPDGARSTETMAVPRLWSPQPDPLASRQRLLAAAAGAGTDVVWELSAAATPEEDRERRGMLLLAAHVPGRPPLRGLLEALAAYDNAGYDEIDWRCFEALPGRHRIPAPHYPFRKERYWQEAPAAPAAPAAMASTGGPATDAEPQPSSPDAGTCWQVRWQPVPLAQESRPARDGAVLILADPSGLGDAIAESLRQAGTRPVIVRAGARWRQVAVDEYECDPAASTDRDRLAALLREWPGRWLGALHLWELAEWIEEPTAREAVQAALRQGVELLRMVARTVAAPGGTPSMTLLLATCHGQAVDGAEAAALYPHRAALTHLAHVLGEEVAGLQVCTIDLAPGDEADAAALVLRTFDSHAGDGELATRAGQLHTRTLAPAPPPPTPGPMPVRRGGTYLVTGGLGGVGAELADALVDAGAGQLVIAGRTPLPPRGTWEDLLGRPDPDGTLGTRLQRLLALERRGATVRYVPTDVSRPEAVAALFTQLHAMPGALNGIVHAAGAASPLGSVVHKPWESFAQVLEAKVAGSLLLAEQAERMGSKPLDFMVFVSSIAGTAPRLGRGLGDYAIANRFQDALAQRLAARGWPATSHAWSHWEGGGLAKDGVAGAASAVGAEGLPAGAARALFTANLTGAQPHLLLLRPTPRFDAAALLRSSQLPPADAPVTAAGWAPEEAPAPIDEGDRARVESIIRETLRETLRFNVEPDWSRSFGELGMDSLALVDAVARLERCYQTTLDPSAFLRQPNLRQLADELLEQYGPPPEPRAPAGPEATPARPAGQAPAGQAPAEQAVAPGAAADRLQATFQRLLEALRAGEATVSEAETRLRAALSR
ncbi:MAG: SDR family oxidoreductase [Chloroflexi bacterium]|nr:SDR family oxidoreductase [Chloroflexota bacterium]